MGGGGVINYSLHKYINKLNTAGGGAQPTEGATEVGKTVQGIGKGVCGCPYARNNLCGSGPGGSPPWVGYVGDDTAHCEGFGRIPPQGGQQANGTATLDREGQEVGVSPAG